MQPQSSLQWYLCLALFFPPSESSISIFQKPCRSPLTLAGIKRNHCRICAILRRILKKKKKNMFCSIFTTLVKVKLNWDQRTAMSSVRKNPVDPFCSESWNTLVNPRCYTQHYYEIIQPSILYDSCTTIFNIYVHSRTFPCSHASTSKCICPPQCTKLKCLSPKRV